MDKEETISNITHLIAIASGKGGVGKSTITTNLALALAHDNYRVGILDADIYGPSQDQLLNIKQTSSLKTVNYNEKEYYVPIEAHALKVMSIAFLASQKTAMIWRGPMASKALQHLLFSTAWGRLDFLLIDLPPGTGDIQLTLSQHASLFGSIIVTTPQELALADVRRCISMFQKVNVPILGVIENMSWYQCSQCQKKEFIFGKNGGEKLAKEYHTSFLGSISLSMNVQECSDTGIPVFICQPDGEEAHAYCHIASAIKKSIHQKIPLKNA